MTRRRLLILETAVFVLNCNGAGFALAMLVLESNAVAFLPVLAVTLLSIPLGLSIIRRRLIQVLNEENEGKQKSVMVACQTCPVATRVTLTPWSDELAAEFLESVGFRKMEQGWRCPTCTGISPRKGREA